MLRNRKTLQASEHWGDDDQLGVRDLAQPSWDVPRKICRRREREDFYFSFPICGCCCCWENLIGRLKNLLVSLHVEISNRCQPVHVDHGSLTQRSLPKIIREKKSFFSSSSFLSFVSFYFDPMRNNKFTTLYSSRLCECISVSSSSFPSSFSFSFWSKKEEEAHCWAQGRA